MYVWLKIPLFRAFIPFIIGILLYNFYPGLPLYILIILAAIPVSYLLSSKLYFSKTKQYYKYRWIDGISISLFFITAGYLITFSNNELVSKKHFSHYLKPGSVVLLKITQPIEEKAKTYKLQADVIAVSNSGSYFQVIGKTISYLAKDSFATNLNYGDIIAVSNTFSDIESPLNPGQFDYKKNLANKSIHQQAYLKSGHWKFVCHGKQNAFMKSMFHVRTVFIESIKANFSDHSQHAILMALLIGYTSEINDEIRQSFTETGIMHLLAVSGLHVGLIYMVLHIIFKSLLKLKYGNILFIIVISLILWIYAGITGFSPSVLRATIMFNFLLIGKNIRKVNFIYNSILVSVFLLLIYDPLLIYHIGFQLSYAAVLGIVFVQPYLNSLMTSKSWILIKLWPLISVTLSAQFFTLPLILYYFNQFPVYFFISNLLIIPISTMVIYTGFLMVLFDVSSILILTSLFAKITEYTVDFMSLIIFYIRQLPYVMIDNIYINPVMTLLLFLVIIFLCFWIFYKRKRDLMLFMGSLVLFSLSITIWNYKNLKTRQLVIYGINGQSLIAVQNNKTGYYVGDSAIIYNTKQVRLNTFRNIISAGISFRETKRYSFDDSVQLSNFYVNNNLVCANSTRLFCINSFYQPNEIPIKTVKIDLLLLAHNAQVKISDLRKYFDFKQLVFDGSNSPVTISKWIEECNKYKIRYFNINSKGAMIIDI